MSTPFESFLGIAQSGHAFTAVGGRAFITLPAQFPGHVTLAVRSRAFRHWFFDRCYSACDSIPSAQSFAAILHHLEARAARDPENCKIILLDPPTLTANTSKSPPRCPCCSKSRMAFAFMWKVDHQPMARLSGVIVPGSYEATAILTVPVRGP